MNDDSRNNHEGRNSNRRGQSWHLEKSISIGHIITTIAIAGSVMTWAMRMDARVSAVELNQTHLSDIQKRIESDNREGFTEIKSSLVRIENKLDGKADK